MNYPIFIPLIILFAGLMAALSCSLPCINKRIRMIQISWLLALFPLVTFIFLLQSLPLIPNQGALSWQISWLPSLNIQSSLYFDHLSATFALLVSGIGTLVVVYSGYYYQGDQSAWRFLTFLLLFMFAMMGVVLAGNLVTLLIFWEMTSVLSFLLIAYKTESEGARKGAFKALLITSVGGVALLLGMVLITSLAGTTEFTSLLASGDLLRKSNLYPAILTLIALAACTKSAQVPFHFWLPEAMHAPTPASAYLHSATMVKAGIYLLARLNPILGQTEAWFWSFSIIGLITMLLGAYLGLKQNDLKALLAYSTISQLGVMVLQIGQDSDIAFKALIIGVIAHALYKSSLFLVAGIIDHQTGTRDLSQLGGLRDQMPGTALVAILAGLSMAGLPPMFGFLAKETLLATSIHPTLPESIALLFPAAAVVAGSFILAQAGYFVWESFMGTPKEFGVVVKEAPWGMLVAPLIPASLSILLGILPEPDRLATFLGNAAEAAYGGKVKVSLALWAGLSVPFILSIIAVSTGLVIFSFRSQVRTLQNRLSLPLSLNLLFDRVLNLIHAAGKLVTNIQLGKLRTYLNVMLISVLLLLLILIGIPKTDGMLLIQPSPLNLRFAISLLRIFALIVVISAALASVFIRRDFAAILALGAMGLSIAVLMILEPDPDVALVQMIVDLLAVVILVLALTRIPRSQRQKARELTYKQSKVGIVRDILVSTGLGGLVSWITLVALNTRPRESVVTPFFELNAKALTGAKDIVGSIVVDFRAFDTLVEITVFSIAGLGIYTLLLYASRLAGDQVEDEPLPDLNILETTGIGGPTTSPFVHALAYASLPFSIILAITHIMYGHDQPGDGFTAGVILGLVVAFWYVVFGYTEVQARLTWLRPMRMISLGIFLAILNGVGAFFINGYFLSNVDYGERIHLPLPSGFHISSSFIFEISIFLCVLGSISYILSALGHPRISDQRSQKEVQKLDRQSQPAIPSEDGVGESAFKEEL